MSHDDGRLGVGRRRRRAEVTGVHPGPGPESYQQIQGLQRGDHGQQTNVFGHWTQIEAPATVTWPLLIGRPPLAAASYQDRWALKVAVRDAFAGDRAATCVIAGDGG